MMQFTREQLIARIDTQKETARQHPECSIALMDLRLAEIALASMEAEPVLNVQFKNGWPVDGTAGIISGSPGIADGYHDFYTAPPAPVVPKESDVELLATDLMKRIDKITGERHSVATLSSLRVSIVEACRAAMLNGEKS
ncbi:hypothetical protein [Enterobacter sp. PTB]|uniref:hypothetical protein n=1 Tax=Enterobacter sp. PTB TaxID=3143437 RepID=UPI003DA9F834